MKLPSDEFIAIKSCRFCWCCGGVLDIALISFIFLFSPVNGPSSKVFELRLLMLMVIICWLFE